MALSLSSLSLDELSALTLDQLSLLTLDPGTKQYEAKEADYWLPVEAADFQQSPAEQDISIGVKECQ